MISAKLGQIPGQIALRPAFGQITQTESSPQSDPLISRGSDLAWLLKRQCAEGSG